MKTWISYHNKFQQYHLGDNHPFRGDRFIKAKSFFDNKKLSHLLNVHFLKPRALNQELLLNVHSQEYIERIFRLAEMNKPYDLDTPISKTILEACLYIIGGVVEVGTAVWNGKIERSVALGGGFHHAGRNYGGGFCIFNDIAVLIEHLRKDFDLKRVLILDYDVHFGNGTSDIYYSNPNVLFISLHQDPSTIYPGKGFLNEIGEGKGKGYNINIPLPMRTGEEVYLKVLGEIFPSVANEFKPEIIIANGGSDAHFSDHLGSLGLTAKGFFNISRLIGKVSEEVCDKKVVLLIGSGYNITVLPFCWYALVAGISEIEMNSDGIEDYYPSPLNPLQNEKQANFILNEIKRVLGKYWNSLK